MQHVVFKEQHVLWCVQVRSEGLGDKDFSSIYRYYYGSGASCEEWQGGEKLFNAQVP